MMKAEFYGPSEVNVICTCGADLEIQEIQGKGAYKTLYINPCPSCADENWQKGYDDCEEYHANK